MSTKRDTKSFIVMEYTPEEIKVFYKKIGNNVKKVRQAQGISQLELSYRIGFKSTSLIAGAEAGYHNIKFSLEHLYKIAKALDVNISHFFEE